MPRGAPLSYTEAQYTEVTDYIDTYIDEHSAQLLYMFDEKEIKAAVTGSFLLGKDFTARLVQAYQEAEPKWKKVYWRNEHTTYGEDYNSPSNTIPAALVLQR